MWSYFTYDNANRLTTASQQGGSTTAIYGYDTANHRVYAGTKNSNGTYSNESISFYGVDGKKLGTWALVWNPGVTLSNTNTNLWFAGRLLNGDRLGSHGKYFPYGEDRYNPSPVNPLNDNVKFATYTRDSATGLDYADQRYFSAGLGRFISVDPRASSAKQLFPQTWNRYIYAAGDPVGNNDPTGGDARCGDTENCTENGEDDGNDGSGGGGGLTQPDFTADSVPAFSSWIDLAITTATTVTTSAIDSIGANLTNGLILPLKFCK